MVAVFVYCIGWMWRENEMKNRKIKSRIVLAPNDGKARKEGG